MLPTELTDTAYQAQLAHKKQRLSALLAPFAAPEIQVFASPLQHFRLRAEFRIWREGDQRHYAMFAPGSKNDVILLEQLPIASEKINQLMPQIKAAWQANEKLSHKLFQAEFLTTLSGEALVTLCYHCPVDNDWQAAAQPVAEQLGISLIGRSRGKRLVVGQDYVTEQLTINQRRFSYRQPEGSFTQPNGVMNQQMISWACKQLGQQEDDLLELYCGNGNFTLPMSTQVRRVLATEISKTSVKAAMANLTENQIDNIQLARLSAEEFTQALTGVREFRRLQEANIELGSYQFGTVFVDPPRAGMDSATCELIRQFPRIIYVSCNPETLANNIEQLASTHRLTASALFDQFPWTEHIESGVVLERR